MAAMPVMRRGPRWALAGLVVLGVSCAEPQGTEPDSSAPAFAKGSGGGLSVTSTSPSYGDQGTISLDVHVLGSGFDRGSRASWEKNGIPYAKITVNQTTFVSSGDLLANITIAADATIDYYDVAVYTGTGKKGIGTELFEVTAAKVIGDTGGVTDAFGISGLGQVVGSTGSSAFFWDPNVQVMELIEPTGVAFDIDRAGTTIGGRDDDVVAPTERATLWIRVGSGWQKQGLPDIGAGGAVRGMASDPQSGKATYLAGWVWKPGGGRIRARWTPSGSGWTVDTFPLPPGPTNGMGWDVNALGMMVGFDGTGCCWAIYWDPSGVPQALPRISGTASTAWAISEDGLRIVGGSNDRAVIWTRSSTGVPWTAQPTALEDPAKVCGGKGGHIGTSLAEDINADGTIVGISCDQAVAWQPDGAGGYTRIQLGGLGNHCVHGCRARAINDAGTVAGKASDVAVYWF